MQAKAIWPLIKQSYNEWSEDKASRLAAALAYYTAISIAPLLVLAVTVLGFMSLDGRAVVEGQMGALMGQTGKDVAATAIDAAKQQSGVLATVISLIILLWGASGVFAELQDSLNVIWEVQPDPQAGWWDTIMKRFLSLAMVFGVIFLLLVSLIISTVLGAVAHRIAGEGKVIGFIIDIMLSVVVYFASFALLFKYLPDVKIGFKDVFLGAAVTAVLFTIGKYLLTLYLTKGSTASAYGAAGSLAALLIWVYYSAWILFFGAEFTQVYAKKYGSRIEPDRGAVPITEEQRAQRGLVRQHDLAAAKQAETQLASQRGAVFTPPGQAVPERRVVTITRPTTQSNKAYAMAGLGVAAGFVVGAIGMLTGRKYTDAGIRQLNLNERLDALEAKYGKCKELDRRIRETELTRRLNEIDEHIQNASLRARRRVEAQNRSLRYQNYETPRWLQRFNELLKK